MEEFEKIKNFELKWKTKSRQAEQLLDGLVVMTHQFYYGYGYKISSNYTMQFTNINY
jgi:hypothetical protein